VFADDHVERTGRPNLQVSLPWRVEARGADRRVVSTVGSE
jgi:hypothetical protein